MQGLQRGNYTTEAVGVLLKEIKNNTRYCGTRTVLSPRSFLQFHFCRILLAVIAAIVLECDAIWLHCYLPNALLKRVCSIRVRIERVNFCETKFKSSIYIQQLPPWEISRAIFYIEPLFPGAFKTLFSFPF